MTAPKDAPRELVFDVGDAHFSEKVLKTSHRVPVVVDFWAPWCGPCRTLGPLLEELAEAAQGRWLLAKVNADENPRLSREYGVQSLPTVKAVRDGEVVHEFTGALPKAAIELFLEKIAPSEITLLVREAARAAESKDRRREADLWDQVLELDPDNALALVRRARLFLVEGELTQARENLTKIPEDSEVASDARNLSSLCHWAERVAGQGALEKIREDAAADPESAPARYQLACALAVSGDFEGALGEFLEVVRRDRELEEDGGRRGMIAIFSLLGDDHALTREYREKLTSLLF